MKTTTVLVVLFTALFGARLAQAQTCAPVPRDIIYWESSSGELIGGTPHLANNFTWEVWFLYDQFNIPGDPTSGSQMIMENYNWPEGGMLIGFSDEVWPALTPGFTVDKIVPGEPYDVCTSRFYTTLPSMYDWHHLAVTVSPVAGTALWLDGVRIGIDTQPCAMADVVNFQPLSLGVWTQGTDSWNPLYGDVVDFSAYNAVLKNSEIQALAADYKCLTSAGSASVVISGDADSVSSTANPDGSTTINMTDSSGSAYGVTLPAGADPLSANSIIMEVVGGAHPGIKVDAALDPGTTKSVSLPNGSSNKLCIIDQTGAQFGGSGCGGGNNIDLPAAGTCGSYTVDGDPADGPHPVTVCLDATASTITVDGLLHSVVRAGKPHKPPHGRHRYRNPATQ